MMQFLDSLTANQQKLFLVSAVFAIYVGLIFVFAIIYYRQFKAMPLSFVFAANIAEQQLSNRIAEIAESIKRFEKIDTVLMSASQKLEGQPDAKLYPGWELKTDIGKLEYVNVYTSVPAPGPPMPVASIVVYTDDNEDFNRRHRWRSEHQRFFRRPSTSLRTIRTEIDRERRKLDVRRQEALKVAQTFLPKSPTIWTFTDFLYFSTIIQSTVGLGDIQPNSTKVRRMVIIQIVLGLAILIVLLNIILGWQWKVT